MVLIILSVILVILLLLYFMPLHFKLQVLRNDENAAIIIGIRSLYGLLNVEKEITFSEIIDKMAQQEKPKPKKGKRLFESLKKKLSPREPEKLFKTLLRNRACYSDVIEYIKAKTKIHKLNINFSLGFADAFDTGCIYGIIWALVGTLLSVLYNSLNVTIDQINIEPDFRKQEFNIDLSGIITLKLGHIINAGIRILTISARLAKSAPTRAQSANTHGA